MPAPWNAGAQGRIIGELHGSTTVNVLNFATNASIEDQGVLDQLLIQLAEALLECCITVLLPAVTQDWTLVRCDAKRIYPAISDPLVSTAPANSVGELGPTSVSFAASLVHVRTGVDGRRGRGRIFLPPPGEAQVANSGIDAPTMALITAFLACIATKFTGQSPATPWILGVLSRTDLGSALGNFDNSFRPAALLSPVADLAVLRSRKKGRGI